MEALSRKAEREKLTELEAMLADATLNGDITDDDSSVSFASEASTPPNHRTPAMTGQENFVTYSPASRSPVWIRSGDGNSHQNSTHLDNSITADNGAADVTARIYSSSTSSAESSADEMEELGQGHDSRTRRHGYSRLVARKASNYRCQRHRPERDELVASLRSQLSVARSQLEQKTVVARSLQRQLDQRGEVEAQTQARVEEDLVAALAKASGVKEELERTSQLLVDGALERQNLEQRCSLLAQNLRSSAARTSELEGQVSETHAELVRVSGALHARRGTDVVDAERAFGEELQRVQETATRDARALKLEARGLRVSLEETTAKFRKACGERNSWREEAGVFTREVNSLRETVKALRQYSENDTIDQLLGQVSRWKHRAEELERLPQVSSPERPVSFESISDTNANQCMGSSDRLSPFEQRGEEGSMASDTEGKTTVSLTTPEKEEKGQIVREGRGGCDVSNENALRQELLEAREALMMSGEEASTALLAAREESRKRTAAEGRVKSLEDAMEANARAARESVVARRAAKARALNDLKAAIRQEMSAELDSLRCELEEQRKADKSQAAAKATTTCACSAADDQCAGVDKSYQMDNVIVVVKEGENRSDQSASALTASTFCGEDSGNLTADEVIVVASATNVLAEKEEKRVAIAVAAAAAAESGTAAWARAFSSATPTVYAALVSLCEHAAGLWGTEGDGRQALVLPLLEGMKAGCAKLRDQESSAVVRWVPAAEVVETEPAAALQVLRHNVESAVEDIRAALVGHAAAQPVSIRRSTDSTGSQTTPLSCTSTGSQTVSRSLAGSQTETGEEYREGLMREAVGNEHGVTPERTDGVDIDRVGRRGEEILQIVGGAPAWEGGNPGSTACSESHHLDEQGQWRPRQSEDAASVEELRRKEGALKKALQRTKVEKRNLVQTLTLRFEREKVVELQQQRVTYELQISDLHASIMLLAHDVGSGLMA